MKYFLLLLVTTALTFPMQPDLSPLSQRIAALENNQINQAARERVIITEIAKLQLNTEELSRKNLSLEQRLHRLSERNQQKPEQPHQQLVALQHRVETLPVGQILKEKSAAESQVSTIEEKAVYILMGSAAIAGIGYMMKLAAENVLSGREKEKDTFHWKLESYFLGYDPRR